MSPARRAATLLLLLPLVGLLACQEASFLTDPVTPDGEGPAEDLDLPGSLLPTPDGWTPGDELVAGSELLPDAAAGAGEPLPPVAAFFEGNAQAPGNDVKAQLLIIPLPTERPSEGTVRPAGLLVGYGAAS